MEKEKDAGGAAEEGIAAVSDEGDEAEARFESTVERLLETPPKPRRTKRKNSQRKPEAD